eukprot:2494924-Prymnesium_polylepis.1
MLHRYSGDLRKRDLVLALLCAKELLQLIDNGAMRRVAVSMVSGMAILARDAAARITPSSIGRIGQA